MDETDGPQERGYVIQSVPPKLRARTEARLAATIQLLDSAYPRFAGELRALIQEIVLVESRSNRDGRVFGGAFTFYLWGALFLNAARQSIRSAKRPRS